MANNNFMKVGLIFFIILVFLFYIGSIVNIESRNLNHIKNLINKLDTNSYNFGSLINCDNGSFYIKNVKINNNDVSYNFKLKDYYIKTAYNACCTGRFKNDYLDLKALNNCEKNGVRALDFEIYSKNSEPIVGFSSSNSYHYKESYNDILLSNVISRINEKFVTNGEYNEYPLFLFFRIRYGGKNNDFNQNNNSDSYEEILKKFYNSIYETLESGFGDNFEKFFSRKNPNLSDISNNDYGIFSTDIKENIISSLNIQDTKNTIFLFVTTNENNKDILKNSKLGKIVDIISIKTYRFNELDGNDSYIISANNKQNLSICLPKLDSTNSNYNSIKPITHGIQFVAMNFQNRDDNLIKYNSLFKLKGCSANGVENDVPLLKKPDKYIEVPNNLSGFFQD